MAGAVIALGVVVLRSGGSASDAEPARYAVPPGLPSVDARPDDAPDPARDALAARDRRQERRATAQAAGRRQPFLVAPAPGEAAPVLVVPARSRPFDLAEVATAVPTAFTRLVDGALLLRHPLLVAPGAELVVDSATVPDLRLASGPGGYAQILAVRSSLTLRGRPEVPLAVSSYDPATGHRDDDRADGRAYVLGRGADIEVGHATVSDLGFPTTGETSGVAWTAHDGRPATGGAHDTTFLRNHYGAYTAGARGLVVARSSFLDNVIYGFDPHTATDETLVTDSVAAGNGRHGFIFSQDCDGNVIRDSEAYLNGGSGFMIDDGTPEHGPHRASDGNRLLRVSAHDNGDTGIVIEGGTGNTVTGAEVANNEHGIWVRDGAGETELAGNRITATEWAAVKLDDGLGPTRVAGTEISGAHVGVAIGDGAEVTVAGTRIDRTTGAGLRTEGDPGRVRLADVVASDRTSEAVDVRGAALPATARVVVDTGPGAPFWTGWTLTSALHTTILLLWSVILAVPVASRVLLGRRRGPVPGPLPPGSAPA